MPSGDRGGRNWFCWLLLGAWCTQGSNFGTWGLGGSNPLRDRDQGSTFGTWGLEGSNPLRFPLIGMPGPGRSNPPGPIEPLELGSRRYNPPRSLLYLVSLLGAPPSPTCPFWDLVSPLGAPRSPTCPFWGPRCPGNPPVCELKYIAYRLPSNER